jgi:hypothetical protein
MIRESIEKIQDISHDRTIVIYLYMIVPVHRTGLVTGSNGSLDTVPNTVPKIRLAKVLNAARMKLRASHQAKAPRSPLLRQAPIRHPASVRQTY